MNEKSLESLDRYDISVSRIVRGRGGAILTTNQGVKLFYECTKPNSFYEKEDNITTAVIRCGFKQIDSFVRNEDGELVTEAEDGRRYVLKNWFEGRECDVKNINDITNAASALATLHICLNAVSATKGFIKDDEPILKAASSEYKGWECMASAEAEMEENEQTVPQFKNNRVVEELNIRQIYDKHTKEIRKASNYLKTKKNRQEFEQLAFKVVDDFYEEAVNTMKQLSSPEFEERYKRATILNELCHGSFNYHNVYINPMGAVAISNFERCKTECQIVDLYQFLRKVLEKYNWDERVAYRLLDEYDKVKPIEDVDLDLLGTLLSFPEKFWKIINQYYNASKAWIPAKNVEKLKMVINQNATRRDLIDKICGVC